MAGSLPLSEIKRFSCVDPALLVQWYLLKSRSKTGLRALTAKLKALARAELIDQAVKRLIASGDLIIDGGEKLTLTKFGEISARDALGRDAGESWERIRTRRLPALALGLNADNSETRKKLANSINLKAAIVAVGFGLPREMVLAPTAVRSELVWRVLRTTMPQIIGNGPFPIIEKPNAVDRSILTGLARTHTKSISDAIGALAALAIGAPKADISGLRTRLVQIAVGQLSPTIDPDKKRQCVGTVHSEFGARVKAVASTLTTPPFRGKVAIAQVYDAYGRIHPDAGSLTSFKERLVTAAKARELDLSRLDLPEHMDRDLRERSHTIWDSDTVHFVVNRWE